MTDELRDREAKAIGPSTASTQPCTFEMVPRHLKMHSISEAEMDALASGSKSINLTFFGVCAGAAISFGMILYSGGITDVQRGSYKTLLWAGLVLAGYFGLQSIRDHFQSKQYLKDLKSGSALNPQGSN